MNEQAAESLGSETLRYPLPGPGLVRQDQPCLGGLASGVSNGQQSVVSRIHLPHRASPLGGRSLREGRLHAIAAGGIEAGGLGYHVAGLSIVPNRDRRPRSARLHASEEPGRPDLLARPYLAVFTGKRTFSLSTAPCLYAGSSG